MKPASPRAFHTVFRPETEDWLLLVPHGWRLEKHGKCMEERLEGHWVPHGEGIERRWQFFGRRLAEKPVVGRRGSVRQKCFTDCFTKMFKM